MSTMSRRAISALILSLLLYSAVAAAQDSKGMLSLTLENDLWGAGTDRHYTHGTDISYISDTRQRDWLNRALAWFSLYEPTAETRLTWSLGQNLYTPTDLDRTDRILDDRPYAGWLYTSIGLMIEQGNDTVRHVDKLELILGLVGPDAQARETQRAIHKLTGSRQPQGWEHQLENEGTVDVAYQRQWMVSTRGDRLGLVPTVRFQLGTAMRLAGVGLTARAGSGLSADYGPPAVRPATGSSHFQPRQRYYWYGFVGAHGAYVDHNIFLDGNRNGRGHHVDKREWVGSVQLGAVAGVGNWRVTVTKVYVSREFHGQPESDEFGSISISYRY